MKLSIALLCASGLFAQNYTNYPKITAPTINGSALYTTTTSGAAVSIAWTFTAATGTDACTIYRRSNAANFAQAENCSTGSPYSIGHPTTLTKVDILDVNTGGCPGATGCLVNRSLVVFVGAGNLTTTESLAALDYGPGVPSTVPVYKEVEITYTIPGAGCSGYISNGTTTVPCSGGTVSNPYEDVAGFATFTGTSCSCSYTVGLFYKGAGYTGNGNNWAVRFAPPVVDTWSYTITLGDPSNYTSITHSNLFSSVADPTNHGFMSLVGSGAPYAFKTSDGAPFYPIAINQELNDIVSNGGAYGGTLGQDIGGANPNGLFEGSGDVTGRLAAAGFNAISISDDNSDNLLSPNVGNAGVNTYHTYNSGYSNGNYPAFTGEATLDAAARMVRNAHMQAFITPESHPNGQDSPIDPLPGLNVFTTPSATLALMHAFNHAIDRWGSFASMWILGNEPTAPTQIAAYMNTMALWMHQQDPYQHLVTISPDGSCTTIASQNMDVNGLHCYVNQGSGDNSAVEMATAVTAAQSSSPNVPVVVGETGIASGKDDPGVNQFVRGMFWGAFFNRGSLTPFPENDGSGRGPFADLVFIGTPQLEHIANLSTFASTFDLTATPISVTITVTSGSASISRYGLGSANDFGVYITNTTASGVTDTITVAASLGFSNGACSAIDDATGSVLSTWTNSGTTLNQSGLTVTYGLIVRCRPVTNPAVTTVTAPPGLVSSAYSLTLGAAGGTGTGYTWAIVGGALPHGLSLNASTGAITGTPDVAMFWNVSVSVTDSGSNTSVTQPLIIAINPAVSVVNVTPNNMPVNQATGLGFSAITAAGGVQPLMSFTCTPTTSWPTGLSSGPWCVFSGTPTTSGTYAFTATATDALGNTGSQTLNLVVPATANVIQNTYMHNMTAGYNYNDTMQTRGASTGGANTWSISPSPACGTVVSSVIRTTPIVGPVGSGQSSPCAFTVTNVANSITANESYSLGVEAAPTNSTSTLSAFTSATPYYAALSISNGATPNWCSVTAGSLPPGFYLDGAKCYIYGTSTSNLTYSPTVTVYDSNFASSSVTYSLSGTPPTPLGTFTLNEPFGVAWPDEPIEFRYDGGQPAANTAKMMLNNGSTNVEVAYQWVTSCSDTTALLGCLAVRSALPANANYTWTLVSGTPSATPTNPAVIATVGNNYEITNGLVGVRVITAAANTSPYNLAPIQGLELTSGTWTGAGASANIIYTEASGSAGSVGAALETPAYTATGYSVTVTDSGPMKVSLSATYTFNRPRYYSGSYTINNSGTGHYTVIVTVYANSKSVIIDEDSDMQFSYFLPLYAQLTPDTVRWRGHNSLSTLGVNDPTCGYEQPLTVTGATNATPIVVTTSVSGSLTSGQLVEISGVMGNTAANGEFYVSPSGSTMALYSDAGLTIPVAGTGAWTSGGTVKPAYRGQALTPTQDAFQDVSYGYSRVPSYLCGMYTYGKMLSDYPAGEPGQPWYFEFYDSAAGSSGPVVGAYTGGAALMVWSALGPSLPGEYSSNNHWITGAQAAGIEVDNLLRAPTGQTPCGVTAPPGFTPCEADIHRNWGIFISTQADLLSISSHQPIGTEQNGLTGINLSRLYTYQLSFPDPIGGWLPLYLSPSSLAQIQSWVQNGTPKCGSTNCYANLLKASEGSSAGLNFVSVLQATNSSGIGTVLSSLVTLNATIESVLTAGDNHLDDNYGYYQLGLNTTPETAVLNTILVNPYTTTAQKTQAKEMLAFTGSMFWDNYWFPIANNTGATDGTSNQIQQYLAYRGQAVAAAPSQPFFAYNLSAALGYATTDITTYFSSTGAAAGSTHYESTFFEPLYMDSQSFSLTSNNSVNGHQPPLTDPLWASLANWELSIQTPPEPRFGGSTNGGLGLPLRKGESNGDGNTEADVRPGMLATGLYPSSPAIAGNLMWAWNASNSSTILTEDGQFTTTLATIDPTIPSVTPNLASINLPGYHSSERFNFATANETALWFINGDFYQSGGHRHYDDGQVSIYALAAPLAIDWNANLYYPSTSGRFMHNSVVYDSEVGGSSYWSADQATVSPQCAAPGATNLQAPCVLMNNATNTEFASFTASTSASGTFALPSDGTIWTRTVRLLNYDAAYPVIYVADSFVGGSANAGKTVTWNLMNSGAVTTPAGSITPTARFNTSSCSNETPTAYPSGGTVNNLSSGLNHFSFTGASWVKHASGGINWDLYINSPTSTQQYIVGNWGHDCQSTREMNEYLAANGTPFAEVQDILRIHDAGSAFNTIILPYAKGSTPTRTVSAQSCGTQIVQGVETTCFDGSHSQFTNGTVSYLAAYDSTAQSAYGMSMSGGTQEAELSSATTITWTISGANSGTRNLTAPSGSTWTASPPTPSSGNTFSVNYTGGLQAAPTTIMLTAGATVTPAATFFIQ